MQPKETFTIKELSELFEISRQAISKHVDKLDPSLLAKNERGYKVVLRSGVLQLASNLGNQRLLDRLHEYEQENEFLREQLSLKEQNNSNMQKLLDQQQQLTLQANQQIEKLQEQLQLAYTEETLEDESTPIISEETESIEKHTKKKQKWWQLWK